MYPDCSYDYFGSAKIIREAVQSAVSKIFDIPNYWTNVRGCDVCRETIHEEEDPIVYPDFYHFSDCNVSFANRIKNHRNAIKIRIGKQPICPECGKVNEEEDNIFCYECQIEVCHKCGDFFSIREMEFDFVDGVYYCKSCYYEKGDEEEC